MTPHLFAATGQAQGCPYKVKGKLKESTGEPSDTGSWKLTRQGTAVLTP